MSFGDFGTKFREKKGMPGLGDDEKPYDHAEAYRLRARILGLMVRDARISAARTLEDCARLLGLSVETIEAWELGDNVPDLPQLEMLAYYLEVPISHFWGMDTINRDPTHRRATQESYFSLRHRMIGALLRQAREDMGVSVETLAENSGVTPDQLTAYEMGEAPIPMSELAVLSSQVKQNMDYFIETSGYIGELLKIREEWKRFTGLDEEVRRFAANPTNLGFMRIAMMFSQMPTEQLRKVAEGMLDITM